MPTLIEHLKKVENISLFMFSLLLFLFPKGYVVGAVILLLLSGYGIYKKRFSWNVNLSLIMLSFACLLLPLLVNLLQGTTKISEFDLYSRLLLFGMIGAFWLRNKPNKEIVIISFCFALIISFISLIHAHITGLTRINVNGLNVIHMTTMMSALFAFVLPSITVKKLYLRYLIYTALVAISSAMILSQTKGAIMSLVGVVSIYSIFALRKSRRSVIAVWTVMLLSMLVTSSLSGHLLLKRMETAYIAVEQYAESEMHSDDGTPAPEIEFHSSGIRLELWKASLLLAEEKPWFGYGLYQANVRMIALSNEGKLADFFKCLTTKNYHFHSIYLDALGKHGLFGLLCTLGIFFMPLFIFFKNKTRNKNCALSGMLVISSFMLSGLVDMSVIGKAPIVVFGVLVTLCIVYLSEGPNLSSSETNTNRIENNAV